MARPKDNLDLDVGDALRLGYGCHYGNFKADHPETREANEARLKKPKPQTKLHPLFEVCCAGCGKKFTTDNPRRRYCDDTCKIKRDSAHYNALNKAKKEKKHD